MVGVHDQRVRARVVREWRTAGRFDFTERELSAEVQKRLSALHEKQSGIYASQFPLIDTGTMARQSKTAACRSSRKLRINRRPQIEKLLREAGRNGLTRRELANEIGCEPGGVTSPVLYLIKTGKACEPFRRKCPQTGMAVSVVVWNDCLQTK